MTAGREPPEVILKKLVRYVLPPVLVQIGRYCLRRGVHGALAAMAQPNPPEWEYVPEGWAYVSPRTHGWNHQSVLEVQSSNWEGSLRLIAGRKPVGIINDNALPSDREHAVHNTMMCYAYVAALAARNKQSLSLLDWGGGLGLYYPLTKNVVPGVKIDYHCKELPLLCEKGRLLFPDAHFYHEDNECFARTYDLVLISASLQYAEDWKSAVSQLAGASRSYVYVSRLPIVHKAPSFVVVQRPYQYGYQTEYLGWFLNRQEFLDHMNSLNLELMREFLINERPAVPNAPEQAEYRGFLYRRTT